MAVFSLHVKTCSLEIPNNHCEIVACEIKLLNDKKLIACSAYRSPSSSTGYLTNLCKHLESIKSSGP